MRFAILDTANNAGLIDALGQKAIVIKVRKQRGQDLDVVTLNAIDEIAERNVTRRKIRFPKLFGFAPLAAAYRYVYRRKCRSTFAFFQAKLEAEQPETALVFNGYLAPNALFDLAAKKLGLHRLYLENGFFPSTMQADPSGINALSTLPRSASFYDNMTDNEVGQDWPSDLVVRESKLKSGGDSAQPTARPEHYIFVPFQVPSDMQILALSPWIKDMKHLYREIVAIADIFPDKQFLIKEHPSFPLSIKETVQHHPRVHFENAAVTRDLIEGSEAVITVNSTVGLEALALGKKVITLGAAHYAIDGLTLCANDRGSLERAMAYLDEWTPDEGRRNKFVRFVFNHFLLPIDRSSPAPDALDCIERRADATDQYSLLVGLK